MRKWISAMLVAVLALSLCACGKTDGESNAIPTVSPATTFRQPQEGENTPPPQSGESTPIIMTMNGVEIHATLNDTTTAQAFAQMLPWSVTVSRATDDLCGSVSEELPSVASEGKTGWRIGEIGWFGGWFTILCGNEEAFADRTGMMIIGEIDPEDIDYVVGLTGRVSIDIRLADDAQTEEPVTNQLNVSFNGHTYPATLAENSSVDAFVAYLREQGGSITINAHDYGDFEKVGGLGTTIESNNEQITTAPGDIILYQGEQHRPLLRPELLELHPPGQAGRRFVQPEDRPGRWGCVYHLFSGRLRGRVSLGTRTV